MQSVKFYIWNEFWDIIVGRRQIEFWLNSKCFVTITGVQRQILCDKIIGKKIIWSLSCIAGTIGIAVGAVFGSLAALAVAGILVWWTCRKKRCNTKGNKGKYCRYVCSQMNTSFGIIEIFLSYLSFLLGRNTIFSSLSAALWSLLKRFLYFYQTTFKTVYFELIICFVAIYSVVS